MTTLRAPVFEYTYASSLSTSLCRLQFPVFEERIVELTVTASNSECLHPSICETPFPRASNLVAFPPRSRKPPSSWILMHICQMKSTKSPSVCQTVSDMLLLQKCCFPQTLFVPIVEQNSEILAVLLSLRLLSVVPCFLQKDNRAGKLAQRKLP